ncbi:hypothetical protein FVEN_g12117 [Fusarium venenatum]|uniref:Zn(2)-C6 fungal-type domain-containing protein n=2 Tax=Fusarium venenatum TaxID=56646 RepID=A0A2L2SP61_9HYPO|nr:uncharacterized protein FVRRES_11101 [Fusarium venenatum]KAG8349652.1 hypothetical protein FVEN_g12117 [Fusarium venenatum]CEI38410.1 unnamed protein product [Fusarium venenatum]
MPVGPFDGRKKRSRCIACAKSHLKCSGNSPCNNCRKKHITCIFEMQKPMQICINYAESGKKIDAALDVPITQSGPSSQLGLSLSNDHIYYLSNYFNTFFQRNIVNPKTTGFIDVVSLMKDEVSGGFLHHAVLSIGAMQAVKLNSSEGIDPSKAYGLAVGHYSRSVRGLRQALDQFHRRPSSLHCVLWTTHLLGLFELMTDPSGAGWVQHLVHGTSKALVAAGPTVCQSVLGQRFFAEIRVFEACRSIIFNEPTFLASPDWRLVGEEIQSTGRNDNCGLNELLNIVVSCSTLRVRVHNLLYPQEVQTPDRQGTGQDIACDIVSEGFHLRQALIDWDASLDSSFSDGTSDNVAAKSFSCLTQAFFSATSIYLSGIFDYEMPYWKGMGIVPPTLSEEEIQRHVSNILARTHMILGNSPISPLLVLFPLRVAGARTWQQWQQDHIMQSLLAVEMTFPVAAAFRADLHDLWARRDPLI